MGKQKGDLAEQIRKAIRESGQSLNQLAQSTGVDSGRLSRFMRGERDLTLEASTKLCEALGLKLSSSIGPSRGTTPPAKEMGKAKPKKARGKSRKEK